jgi:hypothetical protein
MQKKKLEKMPGAPIIAHPHIFAKKNTPKAPKNAHG